MTGQKPEQRVDKPRKAKGCRQTMRSGEETRKGSILQVSEGAQSC